VKGPPYSYFQTKQAVFWGEIRGASRCGRSRLGLVQTGAALAEECNSLGCELERRVWTLPCRRHVTFGCELLQVTLLVGRSPGQVPLLDGAE
jgi:hypothetical protein